MNKLSLVTLTIITLLVSILINSCCKSNKCQCNKEWGEKVEDCSPKHFGPYPLGGAYDYLYFEPGSWWIYRNSLSGETDSIYTQYCDSFVVNTKGTNLRWLSLTYTSLAYSLRSDLNNITYNFTRIQQVPDVTDFTYTQTEFKTMSASNKSIGPHVSFVYPFKSTAGLNFNELKQVFTINGVDYNEVAIFTSEGYDNTVQLPTKLSYPVGWGGVNKYYWAKGYGLVQIESRLWRNDIQDTVWQKWELIKCNLIH